MPDPRIQHHKQCFLEGCQMISPPLKIVIEGRMAKIFATFDRGGIEDLKTKLDAVASLLGEPQPVQSSVSDTGEADDQAKG